MNQQLFEHVHMLLQKTTVPDTATLKEATAQLQSLYSNPECIPVLFEIASVSPEKTIRQLAAVELRKQVSRDEDGPWSTLPITLRNAIKSRILERILEEPEPIVRHQLARVIGVIAAIEHPEGHWSELLRWIEAACVSPNPVHRETGVFLCYTILEVTVPGLETQSIVFLRLFHQLLNDPESPLVRATTIRALGSIAGYIDIDEKNEIKAFQSLVPQMLVVIGESLSQDSDEAARHGFDTLSSLLIVETPLVSKHVKEVVQFCIQSGTRTDLDEDIRVMALNALVMTIKYKKTKIHNLGLAAPLVDALMPLLTERETEDDDEELPSRLGVRALDALATSLPPQQVFPRLHVIVQEYSGSANPGQRRAALLALGIVMEGCSEFIRPHVDKVWPYVDAGLVDVDPSVRKAACTAIGCMTEWLDESCVERHQTLVPAIITLVDDPVTQSAACTALDGLLEILGDEIEQYLVTLMETFIRLLRSAPIRVKAVVVGAIGSTAHASKDKFLPYFVPTIQQLVPFLQLEGEGDTEDLRGICMDAIGTFAESIPKETFRPYLDDLMKNAYAACHTKSARLRECSFLFFSCMAAQFPQEFVTYLPGVVPAIINTLKLDELGDDTNLVVTGSGDSSDTPIQISESRNSDMEDLDTEAVMKANSAIAIEKEIAADVLGTIFSSTKESFLPYVEESTVLLVNLTGHYYEGIRKAAISSLFAYIVTCNEISNPAPWEAGLTNITPLHENVQKLISHAVPEILETVEMEDDKTVAASAFQSLADATTKVGPALVAQSLDTICSMCVKVLSGKALCQVDPDQADDEEAAEELAELDSVLISSCEDVISALASVVGQEFVNAFGTFLPLISQYYGAKRAAADRASAVGSFGEIITSLKGGITPFTIQLRDIFLQALQDPEMEVKSNAAFGMGALVENSDYPWSKDELEAILFRLRPFFDIQSNSPKTDLHGRDNAAGAVSRLILTASAILPLETILPVLFGSLPLQNDFLENRPVYRAIFHLFQQNPNYILAYIDTLTPVFAHVLDPNKDDEIGVEIRAGLLQLLNQINGLAPGKLQDAGLGAFLSG